MLTDKQIDQMNPYKVPELESHVDEFPAGTICDNCKEEMFYNKFKMVINSKVKNFCSVMCIDIFLEARPFIRGNQ